MHNITECICQTPTWQSDITFLMRIEQRRAFFVKSTKLNTTSCDLPSRDSIEQKEASKRLKKPSEAAPISAHSRTVFLVSDSYTSPCLE